MQRSTESNSPVFVFAGSSSRAGIAGRDRREMREIMSTKIQINDEESLDVSSVLTGREDGFSAPGQYNNVFAVTVTNGGIAETFDYHVSVHDTEEGKKELTDADHISAIYCFLGDGIASLMDFKEFMDEFGYEDCREGYKIHKACEAAQKQCARLGLGDLNRISNYMREKYPDVV
jgi:hypothetical protein